MKKPAWKSGAPEDFRRRLRPIIEGRLAQLLLARQAIQTLDEINRIELRLDALVSTLNTDHDVYPAELPELMEVLSEENLEPISSADQLEPGQLRIILAELRELSKPNAVAKAADRVWRQAQLTKGAP